MTYFPMSCNVLTVGHIKCLQHLAQYDFVTVGLLTGKAMKGYKKEVVPYADREYILKMIAEVIQDIDIVPQDSLDPTENLIKYKCTSIASGDGWEEVELEAIRKLGLTKMDIRLHGEIDKKLYASSKILNELIEHQIRY